MTKPADTKLPIFEYGFARWPHMFTRMARTYDVPADFELALLYLWDAICKDVDLMGEISLSQFPVRRPTLRKWLRAFERAGIFTCVKAKPSDGGISGSLWCYEEATTKEQWEAFFEMAGWLAKVPGWDKVSAAKFAAMFDPNSKMMEARKQGWLELFQHS